MRRSKLTHTSKTGQPEHPRPSPLSSSKVWEFVCGGLLRGLGRVREGADAQWSAGAECKKQNKNVACENLSPKAELEKASSLANKLELGSNLVIEQSQGVMLGGYALPADMVKALGDAKDVKPSCEAPAAARRMRTKLVTRTH